MEPNRVTVDWVCERCLEDVEETVDVCCNDACESIVHQVEVRCECGLRARFRLDGDVTSGPIELEELPPGPELH